ncbi:MAG: hypothetical protein A3B74_03990 [Candidatus Kerfeldbacteria bacterium RIFCSPHIGHO2_02_FULL_42_14]|uniref:Amino acid transporter transmembrane domain-containing protein n=1 Tax=Candidatus Kerfeldbacteria bacterium RIFCSPHIGHO2_02_FULL_42_14 TaxID=1798540 RepID=A0A1G2AQ41_9BACT|nr:MAG: hypothetical protein A3B74_03990 [Candidatus Kerfeldbacteria bacterium RIFCSPHIGHO2_02_FULL_42_14]
MNKAGFWIGMLHIVILGSLITLVVLAYGEVITRTPGQHQLAGYAKIYFGRKGQICAWLALFFGIYSALVAYTIEVGNFLHAIVSPLLGGSAKIYSNIFFLLMAIVLYLGLRMVVTVEKIMVIALLGIIALISVWGFPFIEIQHYFQEHALEYFMQPYGVILFALGAASAIPAMHEILKNKQHTLKRAILTGSSITILVYILFTIIVIGITGSATSESAIIGLGQKLGPFILVIGSIFGILAMTTSFMTLGIVLKESYEYDLQLSRNTAWLLVISIPFIIVTLDLLSFIEILGLGGAIVGGLDGILILMMHTKVQNKQKKSVAFQLMLPKTLKYGMYALFVIGIGYAIIQTLK